MIPFQDTGMPYLFNVIYFFTIWLFASFVFGFLIYFSIKCEKELKDMQERGNKELEDFAKRHGYKSHL